MLRALPGGVVPRLATPPDPKTVPGSANSRYFKEFEWALFEFEQRTHLLGCMPAGARETARCTN